MVRLYGSCCMYTYNSYTDYLFSCFLHNNFLLVALAALDRLHCMCVSTSMSESATQNELDALQVAVFQDARLTTRGFDSWHGYFSDRCPSLADKLSSNITTTRTTQPCIPLGSLN